MLLEKVKNMPKKQLYAIAVGVAAVLVFVVVLSWNKGENTDSEVDLAGPAGQEQFVEAENTMVSSTETASSTASSTTTTAPKKTTPVVKAPADPLSATQRYLDAIRTYKNTGYYFQFVDCHGLPGSLTLKAGKKFMLDNRDGKSRKIAIQGGQSFTVSAYNFAVATAPSKTGTHYITCDGGGAASILVQK